MYFAHTVNNTAFFCHVSIIQEWYEHWNFIYLYHVGSILFCCFLFCFFLLSVCMICLSILSSFTARGNFFPLFSSSTDVQSRSWFTHNFFFFVLSWLQNSYSNNAIIISLIQTPIDGFGKCERQHMLLTFNCLIFIYFQVLQLFILIKASLHGHSYCTKVIK